MRQRKVLDHVAAGGVADDDRPTVTTVTGRMPTNRPFRPIQSGISRPGPEWSVPAGAASNRLLPGREKRGSTATLRLRS